MDEVAVYLAAAILVAPLMQGGCPYAQVLDEAIDRASELRDKLVSKAKKSEETEEPKPEA